MSKDNIEELRKQAYLDSHLSRQKNVDKYKYYTDPILQQNDNYVSRTLITNKYKNIENKRYKNTYRIKELF